MDLGRARRIIRNIYDEETEVADKITAIQEELDAKNFYAFNPSFDNPCTASCRECDCSTK